MSSLSVLFTGIPLKTIRVSSHCTHRQIGHDNQERSHSEVSPIIPCRLGLTSEISACQDEGCIGNYRSYLTFHTILSLSTLNIIDDHPCCTFSTSLSTFCDRPLFPMSNMFPNYGAPNFSPTDPPASHAPQLKLAAHTDKANALAERLFRRTISQNDYNSQIYSTCIASTHNDKSIPIIMTLDDNIIAIKGFAKRGFNMPATPLLASRLYVVLSTKKIPRTSSDQPVPENAILLHKETLETVMTFMKSSPYVEQFLMDFAKAPCWNLMTA